tara:strand:- start:179982 stop:180377 length:396 start_codon:yes stop_codon:yes gene_type:complete
MKIYRIYHKPSGQYIAKNQAYRGPHKFDYTSPQSWSSLKLAKGHLLRGINSREMSYGRKTLSDVSIVEFDLVSTSEDNAETLYKAHKAEVQAKAVARTAKIEAKRKRAEKARIAKAKKDGIILTEKVRVSL